MFNDIPDEDILDGTATDKYFERTDAALAEAGKNPVVVADIAADQFSNGDPEVLAGVNNAAKTLAAASDDIEMWSLPEGSLFDGGPVMRISGRYREFLQYETSILGFLSQASGIATNAYTAVQAAEQFPETTVLSFGARHMHPKLAAVIERSALIGGVDGFSHVAAGNQLDRKASGTIPHAVVLSIGDQEEAWEAFNTSAPADTPRIVIADTFTDEADEAVRAANALGDDLDGVRLDTTGSRRGDFEHIIKETRWKLDDIGREDVDIFVSGGLAASDVTELGEVVDGFGIGSFISNADPVDFSLDIVRRNGENTTKRGKLPGLKNPDITPEGEYVIEPVDELGNSSMEKIVENGDVVKTYSVDDARKTLHWFTQNLNTDA